MFFVKGKMEICPSTTHSREGELQSTRSLAKHANKWGGGGSKGNRVWAPAATCRDTSPPARHHKHGINPKYCPGIPQPLTPIQSAKIPQALAPMNCFNRSRFMSKARRDFRLGGSAVVNWKTQIKFVFWQDTDDVRVCGR